MAFRFALLALLTSLFSGHSTILDILANILFAVSIVLFAAAHNGFSFLAPTQKGALLLV
jgi:hypothetical protein